MFPNGSFYKREAIGGSMMAFLNRFFGWNDDHDDAWETLECTGEEEELVTLESPWSVIEDDETEW
jgi:hypothetical protein